MKTETEYIIMVMSALLFGFFVGVIVNQGVVLI